MHLSACSNSPEKLWTDQKEREVARVGSFIFFFYSLPSSFLQSSFKCKELSQNNNGFKCAKGQFESERYSLQITLENDTCYERGLLFGVLKRYQKSNFIVRLQRQAVGGKEQCKIARAAL